MSYPISQMMNNKPANPQVGMAGRGVGDFTDPTIDPTTGTIDQITPLPVGPSGLPTDLSTLASSYLQNTSVNSIGSLFTQIQTFIQDNPGVALAVGGLVVFMALGGLDLGSGGRRRR